jgi:hypothetical protein
MSFSFVNQMEENTGIKLMYPYHMDHDKLLNKDVTYSMCPSTASVNSFDRLLHKAYTEPFAFYLTFDDEKHYSAQELRLLSAVLERERDRIDNQELKTIELNIDDDTMEYILQYKTEHNITFEQAVVELLTQMIDGFSDNQHN